MRGFITLLALLSVWTGAASAAPRDDRIIAGTWRSTLFERDAPAGLERRDIDDSRWASVRVPHNWQGYAYDRQVVKGARHGTAWYRTHLTLAARRGDERVALRFEGVNSYAIVWLNGRPVGRHGGGLTSFEVDVTDAMRGGDNLLAVRVDNPAGITDLPWVSGDDQADGGCCEGSQPFGIFRPVHVVRSAAVRVRPFGVYAWGRLGAVTADAARLTLRMEVENRAAAPRQVTVVGQMVDPAGRVVAEQRADVTLAPGTAQTLESALPPIVRPRLWSPASPTLYTLRARIIAEGRVIDEQSTPYGIREVEVRKDAAGERRLFVNGQPFAVRGVGEYEHLLGSSHAFSPAQIAARLGQVKAAGFNAFRDAHYPHNLRYGERIAQDGLLWWPQFSSHLWMDNPAFRANFKALVADWVRERRNNPAVFLWGLQNESRLPAAFAAEAMAVIRALDPTASVQRLVTTCNGGEGTDWNVPQNWSGTYGGDPNLYADEVVKQALVGEYGAWRTLELHAEADAKDPGFTEDRMAALMQTKARLADSVADRSVGQFHWLLATHENPGRPMRGDGTQIWDGLRELDHVGPANNKGLMTLWGEPLDVYYMFRARQVPARVAPMAYIVSHTWPDRWATPGVRSGIEVYSNCDTVELFNDAARRLSLGRRQRDREQRFRWDGVPVRYDTLAATCLIHGKVAASDSITLPLLPPAPDAKTASGPALTGGAAGLTYLYRVNAGGPALTDAAGQHWAADRHWTQGARWGWTSWADAYPELDPALGSRRKTFDAIAGTDSPALFQTYRYGREALRYRFTVPKGRYRVELYFVEPWYGRAGIDARGWRRFDVAIDGRTVLRDLDIFAEAGFDTALRKVVSVTSTGGEMEVSFPRIDAGQAVLAAIAIAAEPGSGAQAIPADAASDLVAPLAGAVVIRTYIDNGDAVPVRGAARWTRLPHAWLDADMLTSAAAGSVRARVPVIAALMLDAGAAVPAGWHDAGDAAALAANGGVTPVRLATRSIAAGATLAIPAGAAMLVRRDLVSPYAPGQFSFARDAGLKEAEAATLTGATVATQLKGYGGQGYVATGQGPATIGWSVQTDVAGQHRFRLRYWAMAAGKAELRLQDASGFVTARLPVAFVGASGWQEVTVATPGMINAGTYRLTLATDAPVAIDSLRVD
ncbi:malectin domain-containing carbohydrate-binding protein [Sphingomonas sp. CLY1604]|uniref:malectin domain-containing carbohydrate-binding protein n=1 Tax=Sphingomonas sp. CLY1604 TaxID=3457786 RepID=UPI003FD7820B